MFTVRQYSYDLSPSAPLYAQSEYMNAYKTTTQLGRAMRFHTLDNAAKFCARYNSTLSASRLFLAPRMVIGCDHCWHTVAAPCESRICCRCGEYAAVSTEGHGSFIAPQQPIKTAANKDKATRY